MKDKGFQTFPAKCKWNMRFNVSLSHPQMICNLFVGEKDSCDISETAEGNMLEKKKKKGTAEEEE